MIDDLSTIAWAEEHFGALATSRRFPRRRMDRLVAAGLAESIGPCEPCDDDGFVVPGHRREGFVLTEQGRKRITPPGVS